MTRTRATAMRGARALLLPALVLAAAPTPSSAQGRPRSVYVEDLTWPEIRAAIDGGRSSAIIYTGSTEQNGPHMVTGKHNFIAHAVAGRIAEQLGDALVYPTLPFALAGDAEKKTGHMRFPGSVTLAPDTYRAVVQDVAASALAAGFKRVFLMGDHGGGQEQLKSVAAALDSAWSARGARVFYVPDVYFRSHQADSTLLVQRGIPVGSHAGAEDTSQLMYLDQGGRWIRRDKLAEAAAGSSGSAGSNGVSGDPTKSSPELGGELIAMKVKIAVEQIRQLQGRAK